MNNGINVFHSDNFQIFYSNIPGMNVEDINNLERFTRSVNMPEYSGENDNTIIMDGFRVSQPIGHDMNRQLGTLQIGIKLDENWKNYTSLFQWIKNIRFGNIGEGENARLRDYVCKEINIIIINNIKNQIGKFSFTKATCVGLSAIPLEFGLSNEIDFQANFEYVDVSFIPSVNPCDN